jgi:uncharacterized membrane protein YqiK
MFTPTLIITSVVGGLLALIIIGMILARLYKRASKEVSFVRTGAGGEKVIMNGGSLVLPVLHEIIQINMNTLRLEVQRRNEEALITRDRMRVDVRAEFYVRVKPTADAIADAAQTLGQRTMDPGALKELVEGKFVDALRAVAAEMAMEELHEKRVDFVQKVQTAVMEDLLKNGLELESVSLTSLDQTDQSFFNPQNAFDAQGLTKLTEEIESRKKQRNVIERDTEVAIQQKNLESEQLKLELSKQEEHARLMQQREIAVRRAEEATTTAAREAEKQREAEEARIAAKQKVDQAGIFAERAVEEERIDKDRQLREKEITKQRSIETAEIERRKAVELADQVRAIAIAEKSQEQSVAQAEADKARALAVTAEERVATARQTEIAERQKGIELVEARKEAERQAIGLTVAAEAERRAAEDRAEAVRTLAQAEADKVRIAAEAAASQYTVDAQGKRALHEAENVLSPQIIAMRLKMSIIEHLDKIIHESVKPMEAIEGIKIIQVEGLNAGGHRNSNGEGAGAAASTGSLADQMVNSALRYRAQAPLVDSLLKEIGLTGSDINGLTAGINTGEETPPTTASDTPSAGSSKTR